MSEPVPGEPLPDPVLAFLRAKGLCGAGERPASRALAGGVSSDIVRVDLAAVGI